MDSQEYKEILDLPADADEDNGDTLRTLLSTYEQEMQINDAVVEQAEADAGKSGYDVGHYYTLNTDKDGDVQVEQVGGETVTTHPAKPGYDGYLLGDDGAPNGESFGHGIQFPLGAESGDYFLRTDFLPKRMFRYDGTRWVKVQDSVRMTMTNNNDRLTQKTSFVNNTNYTYNDRVISDFIQLTEGDTQFTTDIDYPITGLYLVLKYKTIEDGYVIADHDGLITNDGNGKAVVNLPIVDGAQASIKYTGQWEIIVFNNREAQRQGLSEVLRPKADL